MKRTLLLASLIFCAAAAFAQSATVNLAWDANPANEQIQKYTVYEMTAPNVWTKLVDVTSTTATLESVSIGKHTYAVTASNMMSESGRSNSVSTPDPANPPANARIITIVISP